MPDHSTAIARIERLLQSGATSITVDGVTTAIDADSLRRELRRLKEEDDFHRGRRPFAIGQYLGGF